MASISIAGPVVGTPEMRYFESGSCVLRFSVADKAYIKPPQGQQYALDQYYNVEVWNERAKTLADMIQKGVLVSVSGQSVWSEYTSNGQTVKKHTIERPMVDFILTKRQAEALAAAGCGAVGGGSAGDGGYGGGGSEEEVPF